MAPSSGLIDLTMEAVSIFILGEGLRKSGCKTSVLRTTFCNAFVSIRLTNRVGFGLFLKEVVHIICLWHKVLSTKTHQ